MGAADAEGLREPAGAGAEQVRVGEAAALGHQLEADGRLERAHEHRLARAHLGTADDVQAPVDPVRAVDVRAPGRAEHRAVARRQAAEGVARGVDAVVGLDLDDGSADAGHEQRRADELGGDELGAAPEEGGGQAGQVGAPAASRARRAARASDAS